MDNSFDTDKNATSASEGQYISPGEVVIGKVAGIDNAGRPLVTFPASAAKSGLVALTTQEITHKHVGRQVALLFASGKMAQPVIVGLLHDPLADILENFSAQKSPSELDTPFYDVEDDSQGLGVPQQNTEQHVTVDGKRITIEGAEEVTLKCGKASITLTKAGKILIRGTYLSNQSSGVNRILGGSVQIN